ncbi:hypothetical protein ILYODFUR_021438, partial [Ilyodon furcidens]
AASLCHLHVSFGFPLPFSACWCLAHSSTLPACLKSKPYTRQEGGATLPRSILTHRVLRFTDEVTVSDLQPSLDRVRSASTTCLRPDTNFHSSDRDRCSNSLPHRTPPSPRILVEHVAPEEERESINSSSLNCPWGSRKSLEGDRAHPHCSPSPTVISGRRGRQLPQLPAKSSSIEQALAVEERARQLPMKVHSYRPSASHDSQKDLQTKREMYAEQRRSSDNMSARSSDSDMSDVSALSRASSASRLSSTSYMSIQSERPGGRLRSKSLEEDKKDRRISWDVNREEEKKREAEEQRCLSQELKRRRHTVAGDTRESRA